MRHTTPRRAFAWAILSLVPAVAAGQAPSRIRLRLDTAQAVAALAILEHRSAGSVPDSAWRRLFTTDGYRRLRDREAAMGRAFTDSAFAAFLRSDTLAARAADLRRTLDAWERTDMDAAAARVLAYLPDAAVIRAAIHVMIKPVPNSFVWDVRRDPAIILYLDPAMSAARFENTVAHELHHIGFASLGSRRDSLIEALPDSARMVAAYIGAFGEGFAMLAAAGGPDTHPHAASPAAERARWDADVARFNDDLRRVEGFFLDILTHRLSAPDSIQVAAMAFFGFQGPWYTVGWRMAAQIERRFGRAELIQCMTDPHRLLDTWNRAAAPDPTLARWSPAVVAALAPSGPGARPHD